MRGLQQGRAAHEGALAAGGTVVGEQGVFQADILIRDGRISGIVEDSSGLAGERFDATGLHVFPGGVDIHTHLRERKATQPSRRSATNELV